MSNRTIVRDRAKSAYFKAIGSTVEIKRITKCRSKKIITVHGVGFEPMKWSYKDGGRLRRIS